MHDILFVLFYRTSSDNDHFSEFFYLKVNEENKMVERVLVYQVSLKIFFCCESGNRF